MWNAHAPNARHESRGAVTATSGGTAVTSVNGSKGSWFDLGAATGFAYEAITIELGLTANATDVLVDVGISDGSNRWVSAADIHFAGAKHTVDNSVQIYIPVHVPAGAQLSVRAQDTVGTTLEIVVQGHASGVGGAPGFSRCVALFTPASARGIAIDPGGTANTKGAWAQMTASCPNDIGAMFGLIGYNGDVSRAATANMLIDIGIGAGGAEFVLYPNACLSWGLNKDGPTNCPRIPVFACNVPITTRIAARAMCSLNTAGDRTVDLALYGLVI